MNDNFTKKYQYLEYVIFATTSSIIVGVSNNLCFCCEN